MKTGIIPFIFVSLLYSCVVSAETQLSESDIIAVSSSKNRINEFVDHLYDLNESEKSFRELSRAASKAANDLTVILQGTPHPDIAYTIAYFYTYAADYKAAQKFAQKAMDKRNMLEPSRVESLEKILAWADAARAKEEASKVAPASTARGGSVRVHGGSAPVSPPSLTSDDRLERP